MRYVVLLAVVWRGATVGSTEDVIEAGSATEAERAAIDAWQAVRPECSFQPLWTAPAPELEPAS